MFEQQHFKYAEIFNLRGKEYHQAMRLLPDARKTELINILNQIEIKPGMVLVDIPSGGNYLKQYLPDSVTICPLETSEIFSKLGNAPLCKWSELPLENNSVDAILCCAAMHHVESEDRMLFKKEALRILRSGGKLVIADVEKRSPMDPFLNEFIHKNNSLGHVGWFLEESFAQDFAGDSFSVVKNQYIPFTWELSNELEVSMTYMKLLFGIDKASIDQIADYMTKHLNLSLNNEGVYTMDWGLRYTVFQSKL